MANLCASVGQISRVREKILSSLSFLYEKSMKFITIPFVNGNKVPKMIEICFNGGIPAAAAVGTLKDGVRKCWWADRWGQGC